MMVSLSNLRSDYSPARRPRPPFPSPASSSISCSSSISRPSCGTRCVIINWFQNSNLKQYTGFVVLSCLICGFITSVLQGQVHHSVLQGTAHVELEGKVIYTLTDTRRIRKRQSGVICCLCLLLEVKVCSGETLL